MAVPEKAISPNVLNPYALQLARSYCEFESVAIWRAKTEGKHRFLAWLAGEAQGLDSRQLACQGQS
jgi:hypothetical protein